ncbi:unnamed protein product [Adineta steineri]|uniref:Uncharacterized protein n=1 Tax=Adineta steineri TaxID=433720 RepID=A0A815S1Z5_9BILA|nr:unnamed protein product [Adineta steineri]CAF4160366.1 unnamed protein product [Adineta steineri]
MPRIKRSVENSLISLPSYWLTTCCEHIHENYVAISVIRETGFIEMNTYKVFINITDVFSDICGQADL